MSEKTELAHALADGELQGEELAEAHAAVANDADAAAEHQWASFCKSTIRDKLAPIDNPELWQACRKRLDEIDRARTVNVFVGRYAWALCLIFFAGIFSAAMLNRMGGSRQLPASHVASLINGLTPMPMNGNSAEVANPGKTGSILRKVSESVPVRKIEIGTVDGRDAAHMLVRDRTGDLHLYVVTETNSIEGIQIRDGVFLCGVINDSRVVTWTDSGSLLLLMGKRDRASLLDIAQQIRNLR